MLFKNKKLAAPPKKKSSGTIALNYRLLLIWKYNYMAQSLRFKHACWHHYGRYNEIRVASQKELIIKKFPNKVSTN